MSTSSRPRSRHRRWSPADKAQHLAAFRRSGLTIRQYAAQTGVPRSTLELWRRTARRAHGATRFARVEVVATSTPTLTVRATNGVALEIGGLEASALATILRELLRSTGA
jgi:transposase-like protein